MLQIKIVAATTVVAAALSAAAPVIVVIGREEGRRSIRHLLVLFKLLNAEKLKL